MPGDYSIGVIPVPIPNTEVKPYSADGTVGASPWESKSLPGFFLLCGFNLNGDGVLGAKPLGEGVAENGGSQRGRRLERGEGFPLLKSGWQGFR